MNPIEIDQLKETITIGAGNSATALSKLIGKEVKIDVPHIEVVSAEKVHQIIGLSEEIKTVVLLKVAGDAHGGVLYVFNPGTAKHMAQLLTKQNSTEKDLTILEVSALQEMGNIMAGSALDSVSSFLAMQFRQSVPATSTDMLGAIVDPIIATLGGKAETMVVIRVDFSIPALSFGFNSYVLADSLVAQKILGNIGKKYIS